MLEVKYFFSAFVRLEYLTGMAESNARGCAETIFHNLSDEIVFCFTFFQLQLRETVGKPD